jgi:hypothetical protein
VSNHIPILFKVGDVIEAEVYNYRKQGYKISGKVTSVFNGNQIKPFMIVSTSEGITVVDSDNETVRLL